MSEPRVYHREVKRAEIGAVVDRFQSRGLKFLYYESVDSIDLTNYRTPLEAWLHGRAFGDALEVRWSWNGAAFDVLLLTETEMDDLPDWKPWSPNCPGEANPVPPLSANPLKVRFWGTHRKKLKSYHRRRETQDGPAEWIETRLPRALVYPNANDDEHVHAQCVVYRINDVPWLSRWKIVEGSHD